MRAMKRMFRGAEEEISWQDPAACAQCFAVGAFCTHLPPSYVIVDRDRVVTRYVGKFPLLPTQLPMIDNSWNWIRKENEEIHRNTRQDACGLLLEALKQGGYAVRCGGRTQTVKFRNIEIMKNRTQVLCDVGGLPALPPNPQQPVVFDHYAGGSPVEKAVELTREGYRVACVSASSAYHAGGGFTSGGRHALEEALCSQSTLYASLEKVVQQAAAKREAYRIPEGGVIMSPSVEFFRKGTDQGYPVYGGKDTLEITAVISLAMYNKNPRVRDSPVDAPVDPREYEAGVSRKFVAMAHGAIMAGADALVLPDVGCGVFGNDAALVGSLAGRALQAYLGYFRAMVFTGQKLFHDAAMKSLMEYTMQRRPRTHTEVALTPSSKCVVCNEPLGKDLAVLLGPTGERALLRFLHESCSELLADRWPNHTAMTLPRAAESPEDFLRALDVDGNGTVSKEELRCVVVALMGDKADMSQFEERWKEWDADDSGCLSLAELRVLAQGDSGDLGATVPGQLPRSLLRWVQGQVDPLSTTNPALSM